MRCAFRGVRVGPFADLDLAVGAGEALVLTGRRGLGKHRLLQVALGVSRPTVNRDWRFGRAFLAQKLGIEFSDADDDAQEGSAAR